jgi:hypothetical protein
MKHRIEIEINMQRKKFMKHRIEIEINMQRKIYETPGRN